MAKSSKSLPQQTAPSSSHPTADAEVAPEPSMKSFIPGDCSIGDDFKVEKASSQQDRGKGASRYICFVTEETLPVVRADCKWEGKDVVVPEPNDDITTHVKGYLSVYTYPFMLAHVDLVVLAFYKRYEVCLGQIHPFFCRIVILLRYFVNNTESPRCTLDHLLLLYSPRIFRGGLIKLVRLASKAPFLSIDEDRDRGWQGRFVRVKTEDLIPPEFMPFPEEWNTSRKYCLSWVFLPFYFFFSSLVFVVVQPLSNFQMQSPDSRIGSRGFVSRCLTPSAHGASFRRENGRPVLRVYLRPLNLGRLMRTRIRLFLLSPQSRDSLVLP
uniref:Uncharacterized protein isoform X1 n=1 Tax=Nicotiana tabacum TaxID=4097 RepID=A0A1S3ZGU6_TOBAC|nr:PREDICTED: uncharacterized protein LOC107786686 isoform X1 [Nicotiana tabacum]